MSSRSTRRLRIELPHLKSEFFFLFHVYDVFNKYLLRHVDDVHNGADLEEQKRGIASNMMGVKSVSLKTTRTRTRITFLAATGS